MSSPLCRFSPSGVAAFADWMRAGARGDVPPDLLGDPAFSTPVGQVEVPRILFRDRYEFGVLLKEVLEPLDRYVISFDQGLWTWLAAFFFEQLAPTTPAGTRELRKDYAYILSSSRYFRHLVRMPWYLVTTHGERSRFLLTSIQAADAAPLSRQSYVLDQLATRQFVIASPTLVGAAARLYSDPRTGRPIRGAGARGRGSPRRLAIVANQLSLTYDIREVPVDRFMQILPPEFWWDGRR